MTYTHPVFGSGYEIIEELEDGWCELKQVYKDGSISFCGEYKEFLLVDKA